MSQQEKGPHTAGLIRCPSCHDWVSPKVSECPYCGKPVRRYLGHRFLMFGLAAISLLVIGGVVYGTIDLIVRANTPGAIAEGRIDEEIAHLIRWPLILLAVIWGLPLILTKTRLIRDLMGTRNERVIAGYAEIAHQTDELAGGYEKLTDAQLREKTTAFRKRLAGGASPADILPEAFAAVREAATRSLNTSGQRDGDRHYIVQLVGGQVLYGNQIAEMATGEGKTLVSTLPVYLHVLAGKHVHIVSTNDYLVQRDRDWMTPVFESLGVSTGAIQSQMDSTDRKAQYACDVTYGTNNEFGFDYLRDNMKHSVEDQCQGALDFAIVDEVDSILIDEARTPLIISGPSVGDIEVYRKADQWSQAVISSHQPHERVRKQYDVAVREVSTAEGELSAARKEHDVESERKAQRLLDAAKTRKLKLGGADGKGGELETIGAMFEEDLERRSIKLSDEGIRVAEQSSGLGSFYAEKNFNCIHLLENSLRARRMYRKDKEYVVRGDEVVIVDEFTGRLMEGRQWSDGLHQAVEAKERVRIKQETQTLGTITIQNYFKLYGKLAGMTGTAMTEAEEFDKIYKLEVIKIPTNRPVNRVDHHFIMFGSTAEKDAAIIEDILDHSREGRPVLVGTTSVEKSEVIANRLKKHTKDFEVLHAKHHKKEGDVVTLAGERHVDPRDKNKLLGNITIATNMAGRGTDIKLGEGVVNPICIGSLEPREPGIVSSKCCVFCPLYPQHCHTHCFKPDRDSAFPERGRKECWENPPCGLHVIGTERHEARRIDNQLRGRSGRQGDPGSSRFFVSLEDDLLAVFAHGWVGKVLESGLGEGALEHPMLNRGIERAQKRVEQRNFDIRKNLLDYDEVMDKQRLTFYARRQQALEGRDLKALVLEMIAESVGEEVDHFLGSSYSGECAAEWTRINYGVQIDPDRIEGAGFEEVEGVIREAAVSQAHDNISESLGEFMDPDLSEKEWDLKNLALWANGKLGVKLTQADLRDLTPTEAEERLRDAAKERFEKLDCSPVARFLEEGYPLAAFLNRINAKFKLRVAGEELVEKQPDEVTDIVVAACETAYQKREVQYPVEWVMAFLVGEQGLDSASAAGRVVDWAKRKYDLDRSIEDVQRMTSAQLRVVLQHAAEESCTGEKIAGMIDRALAEQPAVDQLVAWANQRFGVEFTEDDLGEDVRRERLIVAAGNDHRREVADLERYILLETYDVAWKDHLNAMDHLRAGIGLRGFAEKDPKSEYKNEGFRMFQDMLAGVRHKVTDKIFTHPPVIGDLRSIWQITQAVHSETVSAMAPQQDEAIRGSQRSERPEKLAPIRREGKKVRPNDPCPCGSGKKYKKCHGRR